MHAIAFGFLAMIGAALAILALAFLREIAIVAAWGIGLIVAAIVAVIFWKWVLPAVVVLGAAWAIIDFVSNVRDGIEIRKRLNRGDDVTEPS